MCVFDDLRIIDYFIGSWVPKSRGMESLLTNKESFMNSNRLWEDHHFLCNCPAKHAEVDHQLSWKIIPHLIILTFQDLSTPNRNYHHLKVLAFQPWWNHGELIPLFWSASAAIIQRLHSGSGFPWLPSAWLHFWVPWDQNGDRVKAPN